HAVRAPQVAPVGEGYPQVGRYTPVRVGEHTGVIGNGTLTTLQSAGFAPTWSLSLRRAFRVHRSADPSVASRATRGPSRPDHSRIMTATGMAVRARGLRKIYRPARYREVAALNGLDLDIGAGEPGGGPGRGAHRRGRAALGP